MSNEKPLCTVSSTIDKNARGQKTRHSLQPLQNQIQNIPLRHTQSQNYGRRKNMTSAKINVPSIPEDDSVGLQGVVVEADNKVIRDDFNNRNTPERVSRISQLSKKSGGGSRKSSRADKSSSYENAGFDYSDTTATTTSTIKANNNNNNNHLVNENIVRKSSIRTSNRTSVHEPSVNSLGVIREQYCCCSRWSRCERFLMIAVGILATIIIILIVVVGFLAKDKTLEPTFHWSF